MTFVESKVDIGFKKLNACDQSWFCVVGRQLATTLSRTLSTRSSVLVLWSWSHLNLAVISIWTAFKKARTCSSSFLVTSSSAILMRSFIDAEASFLNLSHCLPKSYRNRLWSLTHWFISYKYGSDLRRDPLFQAFLSELSKWYFSIWMILFCHRSTVREQFHS